MKFYLLSLSIFSISLSYSQSWQWARSYGGNYSEQIAKSKNDSKGNSILAGWFMSDDITFGSTTHSLTSLGYDAYITKIDSTGTVLWSKKPVCNGGAGVFVFASTVDMNDNVIVVGTTDGASIDFGNGVVWTNDAPSISNLFIVKYNEDGTAQWTYNTFMTNASGINPTGITCDDNNNIYCVGTFTTINHVGFSGPDSDTLQSGTNNSSFLVKLGANGVFDNVTHAYGDNSNSALDEQGPRHINFGKDGYLYMIGNIEDLSDNSFDPFVRKINTNLSTVWTKSYNTNNSGYFNDIEVDNSGNSYITGHFNGSTLTMGGNTLTNPNTNNEHIRMITSLNSNGDFRWHKLLSGTQSMAYGLAMSPSGTIYVGGTLRDTLIFGVAAPLFDLIVFSLNPTNGSENWNLVAGQGFSDFSSKVINDVICDSQGKVYVLGNHSSPSLSFGTSTVTSNGLDDVFIAKIGSPGVASTTELENIYFDFYPNPVKNTLMLASDNSSDLNILLTDLSGKTVYETNKRFYQNTIDLSSFESGVYLLTVQKEKDIVYSGKLIKE